MKRERGAVLLYSIFIMVIFGILSTSLLPITSSSQQGTHVPNHTLKAQYLAESGIRYGISSLFHANIDDLENGILPISTGRYSLSDTEHFEVDITGDFPDYTINATGISGSAANTTHSSLSYTYQLSANNPILQFKRLFQIYSGGTLNGSDITTKLRFASTMDAGIASTNKIRIGLGTKVKGLYSEKNVEVLFGAIVEKEIIAMGDVSIMGIVKGDLYAHGDVYLWGTGRVEGNIYTTGNVYLKNWFSKVGGNIEAGKKIETRRSISVCCSGTLTAGEEINNRTVYNDPSIRPNTTPPTDVKEIEIPEAPKTATFNPGTTDLTTTFNQKSIALTTENNNANNEQRYGSVQVGQKGTLLLQSGTYHLENLTMGSSSTLILDIDENKAQKDIRIFVKNEALFYDGLNIKVRVNGVEKDIKNVDKEYAKLVYMETGGNWTMNSQGEWFGTAYSNQQLTFGFNSKIVGSMVGKEYVSGRALSSLTHVVADYALENWY